MRDDDARIVRANSVCTRRSVMRAFGGLMALNCCPEKARADLLLRGRIPAQKESAWYPLELSRHYLTLPTYLNGVRINAVVDSGATRTVIREDLARTLELPSRGEIAAVAVTDKVAGTSYEVAEVRIGAVSTRDLVVASYDMAQLEASIDHSIQLVLGQDVLKLATLEIQFARNRIGFGPAIRAHQSHLFTLRGAGRGFPVLDARLENKTSAPSFLDLGSNVVCSMSREFAEKNGFLQDRPVSTTMTVGVDGPCESPIFCIHQAQVGPFVLHNIPTSVIDHWMLEAPVSFGWPLLVAFDVGLDLGGKAMTLAVASPSGLNSFPKDRSGLGAAREPDRIVIRHVATASPAEKAGLHVGDVVVGINGRPVDASYPPPGQRQGVQPAGTIVDLWMQDGRDVQLLLADYF